MLRAVTSGVLVFSMVLGVCRPALADEPHDVQDEAQALPPVVETPAVATGESCTADSAPPGYVCHEHPRWGTVSTGATLAGAFYLVAAWDAAGADDPRYRALFVPVVGPFAVAAQEPAGSISRSSLLLDGAAQGVGVLVLALGFAVPVRELVVSDRAVVVPIVTPRGLSVAGTF